MSSSTSDPGSSEPYGAADYEKLPAAAGELVYGRGLLVLWLLVFTGPLVWLLDLEVAYLLVYRGCHTRNLLPLYLESGAALALVAGAGVWSLVWLRRFDGASLSGGQADDRARFLAIAAIGLCALFLVVLTAAAIPRFVLDPCP